jgi:hypothetical protein
MSSFKKEAKVVAQTHELPIEGLSRWNDIKHLIPISHEKWRQLVRDGLAPPITRFGLRCSFQENREVLRWLSDPLNYSASGANHE